MSKEMIPNKEEFYAWLADQPLIKATAAKQNGQVLVTPPLPTHETFSKKTMSDEDRMFAEALKGMA
jgi:hypothetical protein